MRTTINIDDRLLADAKAVASDAHRSLGSVVDDALRYFLTERLPEQRSRAGFSLPTGNVGGMRHGIDLDDKEQLAEVLGDNEFPDAMPSTSSGSRRA